MTRLSLDDSCILCGGLLVPIELASGLQVPPTTDYVCADCDQPYGWTSENLPRLKLLVMADEQNGATESAVSVELLILIANDDEETRVMYARFLEHHGFRVAEAPHGATGVELTKRLQPALVVMEGWMPNWDGISAIRRLRAQQELRDIPILVLASDDTHDTEALAAGATAFCVKPCTPDKLLAQIRATEASLRPKSLALRLPSAPVQGSLSWSAMPSANAHGMFGLSTRRISMPLHSLAPSGRGFAGGWGLRHGFGRAAQKVDQSPLGK